MTRKSLTILATTDFLSSLWPFPTSYGTLPGAAALKDTVGQFQAKGPVLWIDTGDVVNYGPASALTDGGGAYTAIGQLPIDAVVVGNHDLDAGEPHHRTNSLTWPFPTLAADLEGYAASHLFHTPIGPVGVVGISLPTMRQLHVSVARHAERTDTLISRAVRQLREGGARVVIGAIHEGVYWNVADSPGKITMDPRYFARNHASWFAECDLVLGGHSLGRWAGDVAGLPYLQAWPYGAELGVARLNSAGHVEMLGLQAVNGSRPWNGPLAPEARAHQEVIGTLGDALTQSTTDNSMAAAVARAACEEVGAEVGVLAFAGLTQPPVDGVLAHLPAGQVTNLDLLRLHSSDSELVTAQLDDEELTRALAAWTDAVHPVPDPRRIWSAWPYPPHAYTSGLKGGAAQTVTTRSGATILQEFLSYDPGWQGAGCSWLEVLERAIREGRLA